MNQRKQMAQLAMLATRVSCIQVKYTDADIRSSFKHMGIKYSLMMLSNRYKLSQLLGKRDR